MPRVKGGIFFSNSVAFSQYTNFIEEECKEWPVQKCSVASELVKKFTPETKCHKEPKELCAPSGCGFVQGPEECYDKKETIIHDVSEMTRNDPIDLLIQIILTY